MADIEKVIQGLECRAFDNDFPCHLCAYFKKDDNYSVPRCDFRGLLDDAAKLLKEQDSRIKKYEYVFDSLGIGFREWATKIIDGEAEAICEVDEHERKTTITFKMI